MPRGPVPGSKMPPQSPEVIAERTRRMKAARWPAPSPWSKQTRWNRARDREQAAGLASLPSTPAHLAYMAGRGRWVFPPWLQYLNEYVTEMLLDPQERFLAVEVTVRSGKTEYVSSTVPAWFLGMFPDKRVIATSHSQTLARKIGRANRTKVAEFGHLFGIELARGSKAAQDWNLEGRQGGMVSMPRGSFGVGGGADLCIIDDPFKNAQEADSVRAREDIWDWYRLVRTRLEPGGNIIIVMCVASGQRVLMADGRWVAVEDVEVGDEVWASTAAGTARPFVGRGMDWQQARDDSRKLDYDRPGLVRRRVTAKRSNGIQETVDVRTYRSTVRLTATHPVLVVAGPFDDWKLEWKEAGSLTTDDFVVMVRNTPVNVGQRPRLFGDRRPSNWPQVDGDFAWLFGFMLGDGWVTRTTSPEGRTHYAVCVALGEYPELDERAATVLEKFFGRRPRWTAAGYQRLDCNAAGRVLMAMGMVGGAHGKRVPQWVYKLKPYLRRKVVLGWLDADGTKGPYATTRRGVSVSRDLMDDMRRLAMTCGIRPTGPWLTVVEGNPAPMAIAARDEPFECWYGDFKDDHVRASGFARARGFPFWRNLRVERVQSVEPAGPSEVWDLTVDGDESFIAEGFVVHNSRFHSDDIVGRVVEQGLDDEHADHWERIFLPAVAEPAPWELNPEGDLLEGEMADWTDVIGRHYGEALWPERWSLSRYKAIEHSIGPRLWSANYQQRPRSAEGDMFLDHKWAYADEAPAIGRLIIVRRWDLSDNEGTGDWTAGVLLGYEWRLGQTYILDVRRKRLRSYERDEWIRATMEEDDLKWGHGDRTVVQQRVEEEGGASGKSVSNKMLTDIFAGHPAKAVRPRGRKEFVAEPFANQQQAGNVYLLKQQWEDGSFGNAAWFEDFKAEGRDFPRSTYDDQIDAAGNAYLDAVEIADTRRKRRMKASSAAGRRT